MKIGSYLWIGINEARTQDVTYGRVTIKDLKDR